MENFSLENLNLTQLKFLFSEMPKYSQTHRNPSCCITVHRRYRKIIWATQQHSNTTDLSKLCIVFFAIIFRERGTSHQHVIACRSNKWQAGRKTEKSLESNYFWITGWHYQVPVLHICQFSPYSLPLLIFPLFVLSIAAHVSKCGLYETLRTNASWLISLPGKLVLLIFCATDSFCCVYLRCAGGSELSRGVDDGLLSGQKLPTTSKEISRCSWVRWNMCSHQYFREMWVCPELDFFYFNVSGIIKHKTKVSGESSDQMSKLYGTPFCFL